MCPLQDETYVRRPSHFVWAGIRNNLITSMPPKSMSYDQWFSTVDLASARQISSFKKWKGAVKPNILMEALKKEVFNNI